MVSEVDCEEFETIENQTDLRTVVALKSVIERYSEVCQLIILF